ncbi:hypothetical protein O6H91_09G048300 [Diphasiastrum complanatum]|uniref:Uncharacterized protein n=1 Tax=Diphasiastrum complanatum TaxID=34168 RepID=A0ACC2CNT8_DIPCM|nr:hypothetical protein O6H91_09G048300 [Diphasiastrum complanatum]
MDMLGLEMTLDCEQSQAPAKQKKRDRASKGDHAYNSSAVKSKGAAKNPSSKKACSLETKHPAHQGASHLSELDLPIDFGALDEKQERGEDFGSGYDITRTPAPYCSCTGTNQQCYRWGNGGWQSACCTNLISMHPLPMNPKKNGSRLAGRKMSAGAFQKLLTRLVLEGWDVNYPVDLKEHWAKHGTNRYVTRK